VSSGAERQEKKKFLIWKRNKRDKLIREHLEELKREQERIEERKEEQSARPASVVKDAEIWSAKTQEIRNRLTGKKREAKDRWNRFAGTEGGGGKGL